MIEPHILKAEERPSMLRNVPAGENALFDLLVGRTKLTGPIKIIVPPDYGLITTHG